MTTPFSLKEPISLRLLQPSQVEWVQRQLGIGGYLKPSDVDRIVGVKTLAAFNTWKLDSFLDQPNVIGQGSLDLLAEIAEKNPVSEQISAFVQRPNSSAGDRSGFKVKLPVVGEVYSNQWIDPDYPFFTWGELTKDLTRLPHNESIVRNIQSLIRAVGKVREKHGVVWRVASGYRPLKVNQAIGGAKNSTHVHGRGMDVAPVNMDFKTILAIARTTPEIKGIGLGQSRGFLHFDIGWKQGDRRREFGY